MEGETKHYALLLRRCLGLNVIERWKKDKRRNLGGKLGAGDPLGKLRKPTPYLGRVKGFTKNEGQKGKEYAAE